MRDEERGLLDAIAEQPDVDHDRRVYADWLEDHGDGPRAEFVRLQLALAQLPEDHPDRVALLTRERGLLCWHESAWTLGLRHLADGWTFRRGFVEEVTIQNPPGPLTAKRFDEIFAWPFVRRLNAPRHGWRLFPGLVESEGARRLEELSITNTELNPQQIRALIECPRFERLRRLELVNCGLGPNTVQRLARSELLDQLDTLILPDNYIGPEAVVALAHSPRIAMLRHLDLRRCRLDGDSAMAIASAPLLGGLTTLRLTRRNLNNQAVRALLTCSHLRGLIDLELSEGDHLEPEADTWNPLTGRGPVLPLRRLSLAGNRLHRAQLFDLICSVRLASLATLDFSGVIATEGSSWSESVEWSQTPLDLNLSSITSEGTEEILEELFFHVPGMERVRRLTIPALTHQEDAFNAFLASTHLGNLRHLDISHSSDLPRPDLSRLLRSERGKHLTGLELNNCSLADGDIAELAREHPHLTNLTWLSLRNNHIGSRGARALAESPHLTNLRHLDLADNHIDDEGAFHLARAEHLASPVVLNVSGNNISPEGTAMLLGAAERAFERGVTIP